MATTATDQAELDRSARIGAFLVLSSAIAWSTAGLFARSVSVDLWTILFWRGIFGSISLAALAMIQRRSVHVHWRRAFTPAGLMLMSISGLGKIAFIASLLNTTVANVTIIYATLPFLTAGLAWLWLREKPEL